MNKLIVKARKPGTLQSLGSQRVRHDLGTKQKKRNPLICSFAFPDFSYLGVKTLSRNIKWKIPEINNLGAI